MAEIVKEEFYNRLFMYPSDYHYLKKIAEAVKVDDGDLWRLYSLMGAQELSNTLPLARYQNFRYDARNPQEFCLNLHSHSNASDGVMSAQEWLESGVALAQTRADKRDNLPPFTAALTDHDCVTGAQEIVKLLVANPQKYKNLRVVLGAELGAVWKMPEIQKIPLEYELIWLALNPFDKKIENFLQEHHKKRANAAKEVLNILRAEFPQADLTYEEACQFQPLLKKNQGLGFYNRIYLYATAKIKDESRYKEIYDICKKFNTSFKVEDQFDPYQNTDDIFLLWRESGFGVLGIAHPQKLDAAKFIGSDFAEQCCKEGKNPAYELIYKWLDMLRSKGIKAMDINYQFNNDDMVKAQNMLLGEESLDNNFGTYHWLKLFVDYADKYGILPSGGYDSHGKGLRARH